MFTVNIKNFALTGQFGPVQIGMHREEVERLLGEPDGRTSWNSAPEEPDHIYYSRYEFFFEKSILVAVQNDNFFPQWPELVRYESKTFKIDPWILDASPKTTLSEVIERLDAENIAFEQIEYFERPGIQLASGVVLDFDDWDEDEHDTEPPLERRELIAIRYFPNR